MLSLVTHLLTMQTILTAKVLLHIKEDWKSDAILK